MRGGKESNGTVGALRSKMWKAVRAYPCSFTCADVASVTGARLPIALTFIEALGRVGVVRKEAANNRVGFASYRLVKDLGPKTPVVRRIYVVYDPNSKTSLKRVNPIQEVING